METRKTYRLRLSLKMLVCKIVPTPVSYWNIQEWALADQKHSRPWKGAGPENMLWAVVDPYLSCLSSSDETE